MVIAFQAAHWEWVGWKGSNNVGDVEMSRTFTFNKLLLRCHALIDEKFEEHEEKPWLHDDLSLELKQAICGEIDSWRDWNAFKIRQRMEMGK